jgi:hypothetical protein
VFAFTELENFTEPKLKSFSSGMLICLGFSTDPAASFHINNMGGHVGMLEMQGRWHVEQERDVPTTAVRQTAR